MRQLRGPGFYTYLTVVPFGGRIALMTGSPLQTAWIPLADGAEAVYNSSGFAYFRHPDWLGSSRLASTWNRGVYFDTAYSPYGEAYNSSGTTDLDFTGHDSEISSPSSSEILYDFMFREYSPLQGRWLQPDPAGLAAVNPADPQSWNRYAYVENNPELFTDLRGLACCTGVDPEPNGCSYNWDTNTVNCPQPNRYEPTTNSCYYNSNDQCDPSFNPCTNGAIYCGPPPNINYGGTSGNGGSGVYGGGVIGSLPDFSTPATLSPTPIQPNCGLDALGSFGLHAGLDALGLIPGEKAASLVFGGGMDGLAAWNNSMFALSSATTGWYIASGDQMGAGLGFAGLAVSAAQQSTSLVTTTGELLPGLNLARIIHRGGRSEG